MPLSDIYRSGAIAADGSLLTVARTAADGLAVRISPYGDVAHVGVGLDADGNSIEDVPFLNGTPLTLTRKTYGLFPVAFGPYFSEQNGVRELITMRALFVYHADDIASRRLTVYDVQTRQPIVFAPFLNEDGPPGIAYITDEGQVVMNVDAPNWRRVMPNGETWACVRETANFCVGGFGPAHYGAALSKLDKRTGEVTRWLGFTPVPHDALETPDGQLLVFINGTPTSPEPDQVEWVKEFPPEAVRVPPPIPLLGLVPPTEPLPECFTGTNQDGGFVAAGNACWSAGPEE